MVPDGCKRTFQESLTGGANCDVLLCDYFKFSSLFCIANSISTADVALVTTAGSAEANQS